MIVLIVFYIVLTSIFHSVDMLVFKQESGKAAWWAVPAAFLVWGGWIFHFEGIVGIKIRLEFLADKISTPIGILLLMMAVSYCLFLAWRDSQQID